MNTPNRGWFSIFKTLQKNLSPEDTYHPDDGIDYWREQIFMRVLTVMVIGSTLVVGIMAVISIQMEYWTILLVDLVAYAVAFFAAFSKRIRSRIRIHLFMTIIFALGLALQIIGGSIGNGNIILFLFPILAAILLGLREATIALGMNIITMILLGILLHAGLLENTGMTQYTMVDWIGNSIGLLFFNALITFSLSVLLEGLNHSFDRIVKTQIELQVSQERYQAIIEDQIELIDRWLPDGTLTFVNQAAADYAGISREALIGRNFFSFLPEEDQAVLKDCLKTLTPSDPVVTIEEAVIIRGKMSWMRWTNRALFNEQGEIQEFQSVGTDITERKRAEENLERSENRYRAIVENQREIISRWRPDTTLTFINDAGCRFHGKTREELLQTSIVDLSPQDEKQKLREYIASFTAEKTSQIIQLTNRDANGNTHWFEWQDKALVEKGRIVEFQSVGRDITEEKSIQDELLKSEARYRAVIEDQIELIGRVTPQGHITFFNHAFARFYGLDPESMNNTSVYDLITEEEAARLIKEFNQLTPENSIHSNEYRETNAAGEARWYRWTNHGIFDAQGKLIEIQVIGQDIHERKLAEQALQESEIRYRAVVEDQIELICRLLPNGTINFANHAYARFFGKLPEDIIGGHLKDVVSQEEAEELVDHFAQLTVQHPTYLNTHLEKNIDGKNRWFRWTNRGIFDPDGKLREIQAIGQDIHERKLTEQALQASEARYRSVVEDQLELICRVLPDGTYSFANHAYASFYGSSPNELIGRNVSEILTTDILKSIEDDHASLTPYSPTAQRINLTTNARGEIRWFTWTDLGIFDEEGTLIEIQGIGRDIHEQVLAEQALGKSEALYRAIIEDQVELICRVLPDGTLTFVNHAFARFFGWKPEDLTGTNLVKIVEPEAVADLIEKTKNLSPDNPVFPNAHLATSGTNEKRWFNWVNHGIFDEQGTLVEIQAIGHDIHDRKLAEQALLESEARYRAIVENQVEPVCRWRPDYTLTFVNDAFCKLFEKTREELLGLSIKPMVPPDDWMIVEQMALDLKTGATSAVDENRVYTPNGIRSLQWVVSAIKSENDKIIEFQSVGHDVSEQKHIQQMLEKTLSDQIKLSKANSELAKKLEGLYLADVNRHEIQLRHLASELHDDVLNALAVVSANIDLEETPVHVSQAYEQAIQRTREIVSGLRTAMLNYGLYIGLETLADELSDQLPDGPLIYVDIPHSIIRYDPDVELHLFRITQEACSNAIKHANASEIHIRGELGVEQVLLEITDNGSGFDAEDILDLPDLLRKEHFGLAGMFERAELIHGDLSIHATPQAGSRVRVVWKAMQA